MIQFVPISIDKWFSKFWIMKTISRFPLRSAPPGRALTRPGSRSSSAAARPSFQSLRGRSPTSRPCRPRHRRGRRNGNPSAASPGQLRSPGKRLCLRGNRKPAVTPGDPVCLRSVSKHWGIETRRLWGRPREACVLAVMDALVEDDICILNHEKAHRRDPVTPVSIYSGDESVASHFALVTAYEDIKK